ncbi:unnamed protein product [Dovyalis caffra]|uniref:Uncharacterized protein n=1 Tax=Dovyalis caffra TaxID=77055 RepID=A0AAV1S566_9ROSI|nr:unnamed protein product [Dovyalis caffra]
MNGNLKRPKEATEGLTTAPSTFFTVKKCSADNSKSSSRNPFLFERCYTMPVKSVEVSNHGSIPSADRA